MKTSNLILLTILSFLFSTCDKPETSSSNFTKQVSFKEEPAAIKNLKITTLSTMLANQGIGEWGYAALVEADGKSILFDTGRKPETVLKNAEELGIDLSTVEDVFLSHNHGDHTGGLVTLRKALKQINPKAISRVHVGEGIFNQRVNFRNRMLEIKEELEADGVEFIIYKENIELFPGLWITGPIERIHPEKNYLVINTEKGFIVVAGCGHAGLINTLEHVHAKIYQKNIHAIIGGFHLVTATDEQLEWTAGHLKEFGVSKIIGAHCTGINSLYALKDLLNLKREDAVVGSVGDHFDLEYGISPGIIAK